MIDAANANRVVSGRNGVRSSEQDSFGNDKVKKFKWTTSGEVGHFRLISKHDLVVDHTYQRQERTAKAVEMASSWSWVACGALSIADRNGVYYVIDGQHRWLAMMRRSDILMVPCLVFPSASVADEAGAFLDVNTLRSPMRSVEKFHALVQRGDANAIAAQGLIQQSGRTLSKASGPKTVSCIGLLMRLASKDVTRLRRLWPVIVDICQDRVIHERLVDGLFYIESNMKNGESLTDRMWNEKLRRVSYAEMLDAMTRFAAAYSKGGAKVFAMGLLDCINKGARTKKLVLKGAEAARA